MSFFWDRRRDYCVRTRRPAIARFMGNAGKGIKKDRHLARPLGRKHDIEVSRTFLFSSLLFFLSFIQTQTTCFRGFQRNKQREKIFISTRLYPRYLWLGLTNP